MSRTSPVKRSQGAGHTAAAKRLGRVKAISTHPTTKHSADVVAKHNRLSKKHAEELRALEEKHALEKAAVLEGGAPLEMMNDEDEMAAMAEMDAIITKRETNMLGYAPKQTDFDDPVVAESTTKRKKKVLKKQNPTPTRAVGQHAPKRKELATHHVKHTGKSSPAPVRAVGKHAPKAANQPAPEEPATGSTHRHDKNKVDHRADDEQVDLRHRAGQAHYTHEKVHHHATTANHVIGEVPESAASTDRMPAHAKSQLQKLREKKLQRESMSPGAKPPATSRTPSTPAEATLKEQLLSTPAASSSTSGVDSTSMSISAAKAMAEQRASGAGAAAASPGLSEVIKPRTSVRDRASMFSQTEAAMNAGRELIVENVERSTAVVRTAGATHELTMVQEKIDELEDQFMSEALDDWVEENPGDDPRTSEAWQEERNVIQEEFNQDVREPMLAEFYANSSANSVADPAAEAVAEAEEAPSAVEQARLRVNKQKAADRHAAAVAEQEAVAKAAAAAAEQEAVAAAVAKEEEEAIEEAERALAAVEEARATKEAQAAEEARVPTERAKPKAMSPSVKALLAQAKAQVGAPIPGRDSPAAATLDVSDPANPAGHASPQLAQKDVGKEYWSIHGKDSLEKAEAARLKTEKTHADKTTYAKTDAAIEATAAEPKPKKAPPPVAPKAKKTPPAVAPKKKKPPAVVVEEPSSPPPVAKTSTTVPNTPPVHLRTPGEESAATDTGVTSFKDRMNMFKAAASNESPISPLAGVHGISHKYRVASKHPAPSPGNFHRGSVINPPVKAAGPSLGAGGVVLSSDEDDDEEEQEPQKPKSPAKTAAKPEPITKQPEPAPAPAPAPAPEPEPEVSKELTEEEKLAKQIADMNAKMAALEASDDEDVNPFGAAEPAKEEEEANPFGAAEPAKEQEANLFGADPAEPAKKEEEANPFGAAPAEPAKKEEEANPFGAAPAEPAKKEEEANPFGAAPAEPAKKEEEANPFGAAPAEPAKKEEEANPFGAAPAEPAKKEEEANPFGTAPAEPAKKEEEANPFGTAPAEPAKKEEEANPFGGAPAAAPVAALRNIIVTLTKRPGHEKLGLSIGEKGSKNGDVFITKVTPGGLASESGDVVADMKVIKIGGVDVTSAGKTKCTQLMKGANPLVLELSKPEASPFGAAAPAVNNMDNANPFGGAPAAASAAPAKPVKKADDANPFGGAPTAASVPEAGTISVCLEKRPGHEKLGLSIGERAKNGKVFVTKLSPGGLAAETGVILVDMHILMINGVDVSTAGKSRCTELMKGQDVLMLELSSPVKAATKPLAKPDDANPFGAAAPAKKSAEANPFGATAAPAAKKEEFNPFGATAPAKAAEANPFGAAAPAKKAADANPFGAAAPAKKAADSFNPFG